jgi:hypothetical protein
VTILVALVPLLAQQRAAVATGDARTAPPQRGRSAPGSTA